MSLNGQQFHSSQDMHFRYYTPPSLAVVSPSTGPTTGATDVTLWFNNATEPHTTADGALHLCFFDDTPVRTPLSRSVSPSGRAFTSL